MIWPTKKLGEICEENIKSPFKVEDAFNSGEYPFFTSGESVLTHDEYLVDGENIFLATGGYANVKYYNGKASYSADTWSLKVKNALTKFVFYQILARLKYIDEVLFRGSGLRHLQKKEFLNLEIPLPPLPIQQKIVKILDTIQSAVEIQEKIIEKTKELKKSLMNLLFHYGIKALSIKQLTSLRVNELTNLNVKKLGLRLKKTEVGEIPEDWEVVRLGEIFKIVAGGDISKLNFSSTKTDKFIYPIYSNTIENNGLYGFADTYQFEGNCITVTARGTIGYAIPRFEKFNAIIRLLVLIPKINLNIIYVSEFINEKIRVAFENTSIPQLTVPRFSIFKIPLPPLPEQQEIAEILQTIDQKIEIEKKKKELYEELFKTMLNKIMNQEIDINLLDY
jgi:type I restriction enzyme S subunit